MCHQQGNPLALRTTFILRAAVFCTLLVGLLAPLAMRAQLNETGTITGTVTDSTGAAIPNANVTITNVGTGVVMSVKSNGSGEFSQVGLNVGNYTVTVQAQGFEGYQVSNFYLAPTSVYTVKASLKPGSKSTTVEVSADAVMPELSSNELSTEISGQEANMLALDGRNYQDLATLMPGVTNLSAGNSMATGGYVSSNSISVNGMGRSGVFYTLDGIWNMETGDLQYNTVTPPPEAIDQVKLLQNNYSVQYNMMGGAVFMVHTKTGTDQFHGQAWYFLRDGNFNALNYFAQPQYNLPFSWDIGGLGVGGPLFIPHVYNTNRRKTFFYLNGQYVDNTTYTLSPTDAPTPDEINGIFPVEIHDPVTGNDYPKTPGGPYGYVYTIPQSDIVPAAQALMKAFVPAPNASTTCSNTDDVICLSTNNYENTNPVRFKQLNTMGKIDHVISPRLRFTGEYFREGVRDQLASASRMGSYFPNNYDIFYNNDSVAQIHLTQQLSGTMLNQTSVAMDRYVVTHTYGGIHLISQVPGFSETLPYAPTILGLPGTWLPDITFSSGWGEFGSNSNYTQWRTAYLAETLTDNWTWLRGKHSLAAGGTFLLGRSRIDADGDNTTGTFNFDGDFTGTPIADYLTGYANTYTQGNATVRKELTYPIYSPYAEDQWKILPRLTLTIGGRYTFMPFANAKQGYATAFYPNAFNPAATPNVSLSGAVTATPTWDPLNGLIYNGYNGTPYNLDSSHENYFFPSVGFAWDLWGNGQTSLRGGYSINYLKSGSSTDCEASCIGLPVVNETELSNASFPDPLNGKTTQATVQSVSGEDIKNIQAAKIHTYSVSLQQQFGPEWLLEIAGAGVAARNLPLELNINQPMPYEGYNYNPALLQSGPGNGYYAPYKGYDNITYATSTGIANWNALEVSLRHPIGHDVVFRASFTWAHGLSDVPTQEGYAIENSGVQDSYHPMNDYGSSALNQRLVFASDVIYKLPWFTPSGWTRTVFGSWQFSAIVGFLSGLSDSINLDTNDHGLATRPNVNPAVPLQRYKGAHPYNPATNGPGAFGPFFSTGSFSAPAAGYFGNAPVGVITGPGKVINNVVLFKNFPIKSYTVRLRGELFNMANHPNFDSMDLGYNDLDFGYYTQAADPREAEFAIEFMW